MQAMSNFQTVLKGGYEVPIQQGRLVIIPAS
jgi:hypothetical protein